MKKLLLFIVLAMLFIGCEKSEDVVTSIKIKQLDRELFVGDEYTFEVEYYPAHLEKPFLHWESSNNDVMTVSYTSSAGTIHIKHVGTSIITAYSEYLNLSAQLEITINPVAVEKIELSQTSIQIERLQTFLLEVAVSPENAHYKSVKWKSSDESIAIVNESGLISAISNGICVISAEIEDSKIKSECNITVLPISVKGITMSPFTNMLMIGMQGSFNYNINPDNADNKEVTISNSNPNAVSITENNITAIGLGTSSITITTEDGGYSTNFDVNVTDDITKFISFSDGSGSIMNIGGIVTANQQIYIQNRSNQSLKSITIGIKPENSNILYSVSTFDEIVANSSIPVNFVFSSIYNPIIKMDFTSGDKQYTIEKNFIK